MIESVKSALYRSDDGGKTWARKDDSQRMVWRPFYFSRLVVDPTNPDRVYKPNLTLIASEDGGESFGDVGGGTHGDHHDVWINPKDPKHVVTGDDGGLWISHDGANRWWKCNNLPVSQFYHVSVDDKDPYQVYGGLQDNSSWAGDSAYPGGITNSRWENLYNGDGFWVFVDPVDPNFVYAEMQGGFIGRIDRRTLAARDIQPKAGYKEKLRWNWNTPIHVSRLEKGKLYIGAQFLFVTKDGGQSWQRISPDLTTNDPAEADSRSSRAASRSTTRPPRCTRRSTRSRRARATRRRSGSAPTTATSSSRATAGATWTNLVKNVPGLPPASWVSWVEAGPHADGAAYVGVRPPHVRRHDAVGLRDEATSGRRGSGSSAPSSGVRGWAYVIKEDPVRPGLLYLGTEFGLWISLDAGKTWAEFKGGNFPSVSVRDLAFQTREQDLVVATHGRGIWIVDDLTPLRALTPETLEKDVAFLPGRPVRQKPRGSGGWPEGDASYAGPEPAVRRRHHVLPEDAPHVRPDEARDPRRVGPRRRHAARREAQGHQPRRVVDAGEAAARSDGRADGRRVNTGPRVLPGTYTVRLTKGAHVVETPLVVSLDPRAPFTPADRKAQYDAAMKAHALFGRMSDVVDRLNGYRALAAARAKGLPAGDAVRKDLDAFAEKADAIRKDVVATSEGGAITGEERLREHLAYVYDALLSYEGRPGDYQVARVAVLERELKDVEAARRRSPRRTSRRSTRSCARRSSRRSRRPRRADAVSYSR